MGFKPKASPTIFKIVTRTLRFQLDLIMNDIELKNKGNKFFAARKYDDAAKCYSEAIAKKPGVSIYYTNRALCHLKSRRYDRVVQDCRAALEIDPMQVKAHFFLGQALLESQCYDESIRHFQRAQDLAKEQKVNYGDDIASLIRVARKRRFAIAEEARVAQEIELQTYLNRLIIEDRDRQIEAAKNHTSKNLMSPSSSKVATSHKPLSHNKPLVPPPHPLYTPPDCDKENHQPGSNPVTPDEISSGHEEVDHKKSSESLVNGTSDSHNEDVHKMSSSGEGHPFNAGEKSQDFEGQQYRSPEEISKKAEDYLMELNHMFAKLDERRRKREVPDYLCGKISFDILREPVVTPSGITYDRKDIEEHLQRVGHFDPITRTALTVDMLVPNLAIKEVVDVFLEENEWAHDY
ncbi:E3 ubiquitin-protein ligase CHIP isoform X2 [Hyalella azteca]|uniref:E3 ubiquitin-protein ligase CHIP n=1 Tax=Hyalella azteca TaxID=294128 RepID=A0A8B7P9Z6_HYAAZ|nr:E3 ubiquitin-protein ligase CHIP isoform X2 [Hyalella azteca]